MEAEKKMNQVLQKEEDKKNKYIKKSKKRW